MHGYSALPVAYGIHSVCRTGICTKASRLTRLINIDTDQSVNNGCISTSSQALPYPLIVYPALPTPVIDPAPAPLFPRHTMDDELIDVQNEICSLQADIGPLQTKYDSLRRQVALFEAQSKIVNVPVKPWHPDKALRSDDQDEALPVIHYEFFDPALRPYFCEIPKSSKNRVFQEIHAQNILAPVEHSSDLGTVQMTENIMRFGGATTFPIDDHLYDKEDCSLLGLRFDVMSHSTRRFTEPHYIILCKKKSDASARELVWRVFRYTTPPHVSLELHCKLLDQDDRELGLAVFAEAVRRQLVTTQFRHDIFDEIEKRSCSDSGHPSPLVSVEHDSGCSQVTLKLRNNHCITLEFLEDRVVDVKCSASLSPFALSIKSIIVTADFAELAATLHQVFQFLRRNGKL